MGDISSPPAGTCQSNEPRLIGWCDSYNDTATFASGLLRVTNVLRNGRAQVQSVPDCELEAELEKLGYPELYEAD